MMVATSLQLPLGPHLVDAPVVAPPLNPPANQREVEAVQQPLRPPVAAVVLSGRRRKGGRGRGLETGRQAAEPGTAGAAAPDNPVNTRLQTWLSSFPSISLFSHDYTWYSRFFSFQV